MSSTTMRKGYVAIRCSRKTLLRAGLVGFAFAFIFPQHSRAANASLEAPHTGEGGLPQFERIVSWAKIPAAWTHGVIGTSVTIDDENRIWLVSRPNALKQGGVIYRAMRPGTDWGAANPEPPPTPLNLSKSQVPPSMIAFDQAGNVVQSWEAKSGKGYVWPSNEHGIAAGPKGTLMVLGYKISTKDTVGSDNFALESQLLTFTKTGKFVSSIGKADAKPGSNKIESFNGPTAAAYYAKTNEIFVADGYGNSRIVVFDADTGKLKRMWGAYGEKPLDVPDRTAIVPMKGLPPVIPPWLSVVERVQQFKDVHDIKVSDDGLVYAADRGNRRVQVFTPDGKFITEQFVGVNSKTDFQAISLAFSPDQRFLYVQGTPVIRILNRKTLEVLGSVETGLGTTWGHHMAADKNGNLYIALNKGNDPDGKPYNIGIVKYAFKGYSPATK